MGQIRQITTVWKEGLEASAARPFGTSWLKALAHSGVSRATFAAGQAILLGIGSFGVFLLAERPAMAQKAVVPAGDSADTSHRRAPVTSRLGISAQIPAVTVTESSYAKLVDPSEEVRTAALKAMVSGASGSRDGPAELFKILMRERRIAELSGQDVNVQRLTAGLTALQAALLEGGLASSAAGATLWELVAQSAEPSVREQALALLAAKSWPLSPPNDELRYLVSAMAEGRSIPEGKGVLRTLANRLFASGVPPAGPDRILADNLRRALFDGLRTRQTLEDTDGELKIAEGMRNGIHGDRLATWLPDATPVSVQKILLELCQPSISLTADEMAPVATMLVDSLTNRQLLPYRALIVRLLLNSNFDDNHLKGRALLTLAREFTATQELGRRKDRDAWNDELPGLDTPLRLMTTTWGQKAIKAALDEAGTPTSSLLISLMAGLGPLPPIEDITDGLITKLLNEIATDGSAAKAARSLLDRMVEVRIPATEGLASKITEATKRPPPRPDPTSVIKKWYADHPGATPTTELVDAINSFGAAVAGKQVYLEPAVVLALLDALSNKDTRAAALQGLVSGSLQTQPRAIQEEAFRALLPLIDVETLTPNPEEVTREVQTAVSNEHTGDPRVDLYQGHTLDMYHQAILLTLMNPAELSRLPPGLAPIAQLISQVGMSDDTFYKLANDIRPAKGEASPQVVLAGARKQTPGLVGRPFTSLLGALFNGVAPPAVVVSFAVDKKENAKLREAAYRLAPDDLTDASVDYPFFPPEMTRTAFDPSRPESLMVKATLDKLTADAAARAEAARQGRVPPPAPPDVDPVTRRASDLNQLSKSTSSLLTAVLLLVRPQDLRGASDGPKLARVLSEVDSTAVSNAAIRGILARDVTWGPVALDAAGVRAIGAFASDRASRGLLVEFGKRVVPAMRDIAAARSLVEMLAAGHRQATRLGDSAGATIYRDTFKAISKNSTAMRATANLLLSSSQDADLRKSLQTLLLP